MATGAGTRMLGALMAGGLILALLLDGAFVVVGVAVAVTAGILLALRLEGDGTPAGDERRQPAVVVAEPALDVEVGDLS